MTKVQTVNMVHHTMNVHSQIAESGTQHIIPVIGMGVSINYYSDRTVGTIIAIDNNKKGQPIRITVQRDEVVADKSKPCDIGHQNWIITPNPDGTKIYFTKRKNGRWVQEGEGLRKGLGCSLGRRDYYCDWSF